MSSEKKVSKNSPSFVASLLDHLWVGLKIVLSSLTTWLAAAILIVSVFSAIVLYVDEGVKMAEKTLPVLKYLLLVAFSLNGVILVPMALIRSSRPWVRKGLLTSSIVFIVLVWLMGILYSWILWDGIAVIIGLIMMGVGVIPIAMFATAFNEMWMDCSLLILGVTLAFGLRKLGLSLLPANKQK